MIFSLSDNVHEIFHLNENVLVIKVILTRLPVLKSMVLPSIMYVIEFLWFNNFYGCLRGVEKTITNASSSLMQICYKGYFRYLRKETEDYYNIDKVNPI